MRIAVIGMGFVGGTIHSAFNNLAPGVELAAIDPAKGLDVPYQNIADFDAVFICVPSPQSEDGSADTRILRYVLRKLKEINFDGVIISKVTAPPDAYSKLEQMYPNLVHAPEFLTAANAYNDYISGEFAIIGGNNNITKRAEDIIRLSQPRLENVTHCSISEASISKYIINSFLATKVVFMNEMAKLAGGTDMNWQNIVAAVTNDRRIGSSHMQVPGPDGAYGFGGMCFPKDTAALLKYAESTGHELGVLAASVEKNRSIRLTNTD